MINKIEKAFVTQGETVYAFYQKPGIGLYIPLYQREYSWHRENIEQLLDDISKGVETLLETDEEIRFLGTIITIAENNPNNIQPLDRRGLPTSVRLVIDGQQRLSTIALLACVIYQTIDELLAKLPTKDNIAESTDLREIAEGWKEKLLDVFAFDLRSGEPRYKPKIIRGSLDRWVREGNIDDNYHSEIANYIAKFIQYTIDKDAANLPKYNRASSVGKNLKQMYDWLTKTVSLAHLEKNDDAFPVAADLVVPNKNYNLQDYIWGYERTNLVALINDKDYQKVRSISSLTAAFAQVFSVCHYLLERCCFTSIEPQNDKWAFDMFQSLNATGTPLTAIETFKPLVVNITNQKDTEKAFKSSRNQRSFEKIENLFKDKLSAAKKNQLTNDFLASFAIVVNGGKGMASHFSSQRKWLDDRFNELELYQKQCDYIEYMGGYAQFYQEYWEEYTGANNLSFKVIESAREADLASMLLLFLKDSNHKMAITILGQFYIEVVRGSEHSIPDFVEAVKTVTAFYVIWRSCYSNAGLDRAYRDYFKGIKQKDSDIFIEKPHNWLESSEKFNISDLKRYLLSVLENKEIATKEQFIAKASMELNYESKRICRLALLFSAHETIPDNRANGLMKAANAGTQKYLTVAKWNDTDIKTIEHIAPQKNGGYWDDALYTEGSQLVQSIGNLTLLPTAINSSAGNKNWSEKLLYFKHLNEKDPARLAELANKAAAQGSELAESTIKLLQAVNYNEHIAPIVAVGDAEWNADLVERRTRRILEIMWERVSGWVVE